MAVLCYVVMMHMLMRNMVMYSKIVLKKIWNTTLYEKHKLIFSKVYQKEKDNLFCNKCSRATFNKRPYNNFKAVNNFNL